MVEMKSKVLLCLMIVFISLESSSPGKKRIHHRYDTVIAQELTVPLDYLRSVCGKDGINKVVIL